MGTTRDDGRSSRSAQKDSQRILSERYALVEMEEPRKGGMAEVRRAVDLSNNGQFVAIKFFKTETEAGRLHLEAYSRECHALQLLDHPNIVQVLDVGTDASGRRFLVLEWLETSLERHVTANPPADWDTFYENIGKPILDGLVYAYGRGVLHRDLKPNNVLLSQDGVVKIVDFGISKLRSYISLGLTVAGFRSEPYAPPETDDGRNSESRDVFGFAVLAIECLSTTRFSSYEDVYRGLEDFDGPTEIASTFRLALSRNLDERQGNISVLKSELDKIQADREASLLSMSHRRCYVKITRKVEDKLKKTLDHAGIDVKRFVIDDINEICGLKHYSPQSQRNGSLQQDGIHLSLYAAQYLYYGVIDRESRSFLVLHDVSPWSSSYLEFHRDSAWKPDIDFHLQIMSSPRKDGTEIIEWLVAGLAEHETTVAQQRETAQNDEFFRKWTSILHAKNEIERQREKPIPYDGFKKDGNRLLFFTRCVVENSVIGQPRLVKVPGSANQVVAAGDIDAVDDDFVVLWVEEEPSDPIPNRGELQFDTRASRRAIHRQRQALDAVRFRRSVRPDLRDLVVDPKKVKVPVDSGEIKIGDHLLDESKRQAVRKALGTESFLVVEGPPGTGKTRFITEVVLQTLTRDPKARILVTSQTHVALDNALEQIRQADHSLKLVRIGHRHDERVSQGIKDLLLENRVDTWLESVKEKSEQFLSMHATSLGVDRTEVALGMAAAALRVARGELEVLELQHRKAIADVNRLTRQKDEMSVTNRGDTYNKFEESLRESREIAKQLDHEMKRVKRRIRDARDKLKALPDLGPGLAALPADEVREWEEEFLNRTGATRELHRLVKLAEEWYLRFGRSRDFFGALVADSQVVAGTCLGFAGVPGIQSVEFDLCIVDEASKATVTELFVPLSRSRKWILVGDRRQLPPFVENTLGDADLLRKHDLAKDDLKVTFLDILFDRLPTECVTALVYQYRMIRQIGDLVGNCFYDGELRSLREGDAGQLAPALPKPVTWFDTADRCDRRELDDQGSYKNLAEVDHVCTVLRRLNFQARVQEKKYDVAVLSGYASQKLETRRALDRERQDLECLSIDCNTVDAFQGREADIALYSVTRSNDSGTLGFLRDRRRLNVALSRARIGLGIVGDVGFVRTASGDNPWTRVLDYMESHPEDCAFEAV